MLYQNNSDTSIELWATERWIENHNYLFASTPWDSRTGIRRLRGDKKRELINLLISEQDWKCLYCWEILLCTENIQENNATIDHIIPVFEGWQCVASNLVACCSVCNNKKLHTKPTDFMKYTSETDTCIVMKTWYTIWNEKILECMRYLCSSKWIMQTTVKAFIRKLSSPYYIMNLQE